MTADVVSGLRPFVEADERDLTPAHNGGRSHAPDFAVIARPATTQQDCAGRSEAGVTDYERWALLAFTASAHLSSHQQYVCLKT